MAEPQTASGTTTSGGQRTSPPFRADHVGSLLRPPELLRARHVLGDPAAAPAEVLALLMRVHRGDEFELEGET